MCVLSARSRCTWLVELGEIKKALVSMMATDMDQAVSALKDMKMQQLAFVSTGWVVMERAKAAKQSYCLQAHLCAKWSWSLNGACVDLNLIFPWGKGVVPGSA